jgi:hypothetical protein
MAKRRQKLARAARSVVPAVELQGRRARKAATKAAHKASRKARHRLAS